MHTVVVVPPDPVVTVDEAKSHLRIDGNDEDSLIGIYVAAATSHIDGPSGSLGRCVGVQTLEVELPLCRQSIRLPYPPIIDIDTVTSVDGDGSETLLDASDYVLADGRLRPPLGKTWPNSGSRGGLLRVRYRAGYGLTSDPPVQALPPSIRSAILLMTAGLYSRDPAAQADAFSAADGILFPLRVLG